MQKLTDDQQKKYKILTNKGYEIDPNISQASFDLLMKSIENSNSDDTDDVKLSDEEKKNWQGKTEFPIGLSDDTESTVTTDDSTRPKKKVQWQGFTIALQYFPFEQRHGVTLRSAYGHIEGTRNIGMVNGKPGDQMALDCYVGTNLESPKLFIFNQHINDSFDEIKFVIGVTNIDQAINAVSMLPTGFVRNMREVPLTFLDQYRLK